MTTTGTEGPTLRADCPFEGADAAVDRREHRFAVARLAALARDAWCCQTCGATDRDIVIVVHHVQPATAGYDGRSCEHHQENLISLCVACHAHVHRHLRAVPGTQLDLPGLVVPERERVSA